MKAIQERGGTITLTELDIAGLVADVDHLEELLNEHGGIEAFEFVDRLAGVIRELYY